MYYDINKLTKVLEKNTPFIFKLATRQKRADLRGAYLSGAEARHG